MSPRISPLLLLLRTAGETDGEAAALHAELDDARLARMADNARHLVDGGHLRSGVTADEARDVLWLCSSCDEAGRQRGSARSEARTWLRHALEHAHPDHPWIARLT